MKTISKTTRRPLSDLVREAIGAWTREWEREQLRLDILDYASEMAGTPDDLDEDLENAALENLRAAVRE